MENPKWYEKIMDYRKNHTALDTAKFFDVTTQAVYNAQRVYKNKKGKITSLPKGSNSPKRTKSLWKTRI